MMVYAPITSAQSAYDSETMYDIIQGSSHYNPYDNCSATGTDTAEEININNTAAEKIAQADSKGGTNVGYALYDSAGANLASYNDTFENYGASITKAMILVAYLNQEGNATATMSAQAQAEVTGMIEQSNDADANDVYNMLIDPSGQISDVASAAGMTGFKINDTGDSLYWLGQSQITAQDFAKFFSIIDTMIPATQKTFGLDLLSHITPNVGLLQAGLPGTVYSKEGWKPEPGGGSDPARAGGNPNPFGKEGVPYIVNQAGQFTFNNVVYGIAVTVGGTATEASGEAIIKNVVKALITFSTPSTQPTTGVTATGGQATIAKDIIGIAKTENLGEGGAQIGLMVGLDESTLTNLANSNVPISESNPNKQGSGSNGFSLGVFQQQITDDWSTISSSVSNADAVNQLMTPTYAAEAFFGSPSGATNVNPALSKGLQNVSGWQQMQTWVAAQAVQKSGTPDGSNYEQQVGAAKALLNQYWASAPAIPLPVAMNGTGGGTSGGASSTSSACNGSTSTTVDCNGSVPAGTTGLSTTRQKIVCIVEGQLAIWDSKPDYATANFPYAHSGFTGYTQGRYEEWCADFASWAYNQAGDPLASPDWNLPGVSGIQAVGQNGGKFTYHGAGYTPVPGDLAIHGGFHVNIYIGTIKGVATYIGGDQGNYQTYGGPPPTSNSIVSYEYGNGYYDNGITGYVSPN